jgi:hypothetical protein
VWRNPARQYDSIVAETLKVEEIEENQKLDA